MTPILVEAARGRPTGRTPVWVMRQAGRYLPEYRRIREKVPFQEAVATPAVAAEITLQPIERFGMDGAVIFADIMTPLEAMGVDMEFDPGPRLRPHTLEEVADLADLDPDRVGSVAETIRLVRSQLPPEAAVIGFAGAPFTLLAYLLEGGGSRDFVRARAALAGDRGAARRALSRLASAMHDYLDLQIAAGADVVQLFDSWAGVLDRDTFRTAVSPAAARTLADLAAPTIYFAPHAPHLLGSQSDVGADVYGVDWRTPLGEARLRLGTPVQGNLDPAVLLTDPEHIRTAVAAVMDEAGGAPGHIFNLGHGIHRSTPPEHVAAMVEAVRS